MKHLLIASLLFAPAAFGQNIDFSSLDRLASRAKEANVVTLSKDQLQGAMGLIGDKRMDDKDAERVRKIVSQLTSVEVHNYEFDKKGAFRQEELDPLRMELSRKLRDWSRVVDTREESAEGQERTQIFMRTVNGKTTGLAIFSVEPKEITVVMLEGVVDSKDLGGLSGALGLPMMKLAPQDKAPAKE